MYDEVKWLRWDLKGSEARKEKLKERVVKLHASVATLSKLPSDEAAELRKALRRSRRQKPTIRSLNKENARLRRALRGPCTRTDGSRCRRRGGDATRRRP